MTITENMNSIINVYFYNIIIYFTCKVVFCTISFLAI